MQNAAQDATLERTLEAAEREGMRLAVRARLVALVVLALWFVGSRSLDSTKMVGYALALGGFALLGYLHYRVIGTPRDLPWVKYAFVALDLLALTLLVVTQPMYAEADLPQATMYRNPVFPIYFVVLGITAFSFSPRLVAWAGVVGAVAWMVGFGWVVGGMEETVSWFDIPVDATTAEVEAIFLSANFIGTGSRIQEAITYLVVAMLIAFVMARARSTVRRQLMAEADRQRVNEVFGQYVPPAVASALVADGGVLSPVERDATVLFVDLAGFTRMTGELGPTETVQVLNEYFDAVTGVIGEHRGVVTQFQGDAVLAVFNVPADDPDHARHAVEAGLGMMAVVASRTFAGRRLAVRIGIATGPVVAGSVGGGGRQTYTVHGDTVNLAARLEALNKSHGTTLLAAADTAVRADGIPFEARGEVEVRGFEQPVSVMTPAGRE